MNDIGKSDKSKTSNKKKTGGQQWIVTALALALGMICGFLISYHMVSGSLGDRSLGETVILAGFLLLSIYLAMFLQIILHETGHLVFGLLTGYRFSSFRIGNLMWLRAGGKLELKRMSLAGTGGQCLMAPPDMENGTFPVLPYNLGGPIMNGCASALFLAWYFLISGHPLIRLFLLMLAVIGIFFAVMNGVPMRLNMVDNDGRNAFSLGKNPEALRSFWVQLKVSQQQVQGCRLRDMPEEWFLIPSDAQMQNGVIAVMGVFVCNRLMDQHCFEEAERLMRRFLEMDTGMAGLHRQLMYCDRMYCEMIGENRRSEVNRLASQRQKTFLKTMKHYPSVLRTEYTYALLSERDMRKAEAMRERFEKAAAVYPYPSDIEGERELMEIATERAEQLRKRQSGEA